jgi:hypothetical protein
MLRIYSNLDPYALADPERGLPGVGPSPFIRIFSQDEVKVMHFESGKPIVMLNLPLSLKNPWICHCQGSHFSRLLRHATGCWRPIRTRTLLLWIRCIKMLLLHKLWVKEKPLYDLRCPSKLFVWNLISIKSAFVELEQYSWCCNQYHFVYKNLVCCHSLICTDNGLFSARKQGDLY